MKKTIFTALAFLAVLFVTGQVNSKLFTFTKEVTYNKQKQLSFLIFKESPSVSEAEVPEFINTMLFANSANKVEVFKTEKDEYGFSHTKYSILQNGIALSGKIIIAHCKNGQLQSLNGDLHPFSSPTNKFSLNEKSALTFALKKIHAKKYKWENKEEENHIREINNDPGFTYYPKGIKVIYDKDGKLFNAYKFDIYAEAPLYRANVFVDAATGKVLAEHSLICNIDVPGTAATKYSGTVTTTCDLTGGIYSLKETQRGLGIETYNLNKTTNYNNAVNFTNTSANWTNWLPVSTASNQAATDAHWGAEKTYDFYMSKFNRNSIDNAGYKLRSYVHYGNNYNNAFWDGTRMTYGDGNNTTFSIFTALDVCGHEITHGLVSNTANLGGTGTSESDALNEAFADIFGTSIERYARPLNWDWLLGKDLTTNGQGLRNMQNPNALQNPDTYNGTYWDAGGEPHNNATPCGRWFYLLVMGGSGTNDIGNAYSVTAIGNVDAEKIAYRALTVYFTPNTNYAAARLGSVQAAKDLFGDCSAQVEATARAWYAVGVGANYSVNTIAPNFSSNVNNFCNLPATVNFNNSTGNGSNFIWSFGDGTTSTGTNVVHTYTAPGTYNVKLKATGCANALDSITKPSYIVINVPATPVATGGIACGGGAVTLNASGTGFMSWFMSPFSSSSVGTGNSFITPILSSNTTFYVSNSISNSPVTGGMALTTNQGTYSNANANFLKFDVLQASTLNSVVVMASGGGNRIIELRLGGTVLNSVNIGLTAGMNTLTLNFPLTPGTNYELGLSASSPVTNLFRSTTGVAFPYNIGGCVSITGSSTGYYYWFYKWTVTQADCISPAVAVTASVGTTPLVSLSAPVSNFCVGDQSVNLIGTPPGGIYTGVNVSGSMFYPQIPGNSNAMYTYTDPDGCSDSTSVNMNVMICTGLNALQANNAGLSVFPNPATDYLMIKNELGDVNISINDASGRLIFTKSMQSAEETVSLQGLSKGLYLLNVKDLTGQTIKTIKLVRE